MSNMTVPHTYRQMSRSQHACVDYIAAHPGCSIADVDGACRRNMLAGHRWVYACVARLVLQHLVRFDVDGSRKRLYIDERGGRS